MLAVLACRACSGLISFRRGRGRGSDPRRSKCSLPICLLLDQQFRFGTIIAGRVTGRISTLDRCSFLRVRFRTEARTPLCQYVHDVHFVTELRGPDPARLHKAGRLLAINRPTHLFPKPARAGPWPLRRPQNNLIGQQEDRLVLHWAAEEPSA